MPAKRLPPQDAFWARVQKADGCWLWGGDKTGVGYGLLTVGTNRDRVSAHRFSWELHNGPIPEGMFVCHKCDVRGCVRPDHLFLGTPKDNAVDMARKGRGWGPKGPLCRFTKLNERQVKEIRVLISQGHSQREIAGKYSVSHRCIGAINRGITWKYVS